MAVPREERTAQVRIHLTTKSEDLQLPETGPILVSTEFRRYQLSTLVNRLLETEKPVPLEFLINGQFLRTSLDEFLVQNGISAETSLRVEYVRALSPPLFVASYEHPDWVTSVDVLSSSSDAARSGQDRFHGPIRGRILSGSYDKVVRVWNMSSEVVATGHGHTLGVKAVKFISPDLIASAGEDRSVRLWNFEDVETGTSQLTPSLELYGHKGWVEHLAVHTPSSRMLSASLDNTVAFWSIHKSELPAVSEQFLPRERDTADKTNKRRKLSNPSTSSSTPQRGPLTILSGHTSPVPEVCFDENDPTVGYSCSWDHTVKTWDLTTSVCVDTRTTPQPLFSILHLPSPGLIATGTDGRHITLLDPRVSAKTTTAMTLRGHKQWPVSLSRDPSSEYHFVSGSHDSTCRIWDVRSVRAEAGTERMGRSVYVIARESQKGRPKPGVGEESSVYGVCWDREVGIVSGGKDCMVQINRGAE